MVVILPRLGTVALLATTSPSMHATRFTAVSPRFQVLRRTTAMLELFAKAAANQEQSLGKVPECLVDGLVVPRNSRTLGVLRLSV
jgi:hypothetical protein